MNENSITVASSNLCNIRHDINETCSIFLVSRANECLRKKKIEGRISHISRLSVSLIKYTRWPDAIHRLVVRGC